MADKHVVIVIADCPVFVKAVQSARSQAHALLEAAKRAVEIAIEESEAAALAYLAGFPPANA